MNECPDKFCPYCFSPLYADKSGYYCAKCSVEIPASRVQSLIDLAAEVKELEQVKHELQNQHR